MTTRTVPEYLVAAPRADGEYRFLAGELGPDRYSFALNVEHARRFDRDTAEVVVSWANLNGAVIQPAPTVPDGGPVEAHRFLADWHCAQAAKSGARPGGFTQLHLDAWLAHAARLNDLLNA